jgi:urea-proton symporter
VLIIWQWPEDFDFEITRAINAPDTKHVHARDSPDEDEDEKKSKEAVEIAAAENDDSDKELDPAGLNKAFRFAAWSSVALVGPFLHRVILSDELR